MISFSLFKMTYRNKSQYASSSNPTLVAFSLESCLSYFVMCIGIFLYRVLRLKTAAQLKLCYMCWSVLRFINELHCSEIWAQNPHVDKEVSVSPGDTHVPCWDDECGPMEQIDQWSGLTLQNYTAINCVLSSHPSCAAAFIDEDLLITHQLSHSYSIYSQCIKALI